MLTRPTPPRAPFVITRTSRRRRRWPWLVGVGALLLVGAFSAVWLAWPSGSIGVSAEGLPQPHVSRLAGDVVRVSVHRTDGTPVPVVARSDGTLVPVRRVQAGTHFVAEVVVRRPNAVGWLVGHTQTIRRELEAPSIALRARWLRVRPGTPVRVSFDQPVREVRVTGIHPWHVIRPAKPAQVVSLGRLGQAGTVGVSAVALRWERLPPPTAVTWFPPGKEPMLLASPKPGGELGPVTPLRLRFSTPVARVLRGKMPTVQPAAAGRWRAPDAHTLEFRPRGLGFGLDGRVKVRLPVPVRRIGGARMPTSTIVWATPQTSELRLEQLFALLRYLPLTWTATTADAPRTIAGQYAAAVAPPAGTFTWRYPNTPPELVHLWQPGHYTAIVRGAVMAFQNEHHLTVDGYPGHDLWQALIADVIAGKPRPGGYSYVYVHSNVPQSLNLWHDGRVILTSPGNTGVPAAPTQLGTFEVFEHIPVGTMSGTNPDGSHYHDPGIRWISYFNHGEAIHAFNRSSFGTPQSLGCVELPLAAAAKVWPYTPIGTLVSVER